MGEDRRSNGNKLYIEAAMQVYNQYESGRLARKRIERKASKGIFTADTVERYMGEER